MSSGPIPSQIMTDGFAVTPSDTTIAGFSALWIGVAGSVVITTVSGEVLTFLNYPVGWFPMSGVKVMAATSASSIVGCN